MKQGKFYVVGVGPGDPQLMTLKAVNILKNCNVWFVPSAFDNGNSMALKIASGVVESTGKTILSHQFPMKQIHRGQEPDPEVKSAWQEAAKTIMEYLGAGKDVVFPTLGDPAIYSTGFYVCETLQEYGSPFSVEIVPGVSAIGASSAVSGVPLCLGDERLSVIPATFENDRIKELLNLSDVAVFMKVYRVMPRLVALLEDLGLVDNAVLIERCSLENERVWTDIREAVGQKIHYFSTMVVRKSVSGNNVARLQNKVADLQEQIRNAAQIAEEESATDDFNAMSWLDLMLEDQPDAFDSYFDTTWSELSSNERSDRARTIRQVI